MIQVGTAVYFLQVEWFLIKLEFIMVLSNVGANLSSGALNRELIPDSTKEEMKNEQNAEEVLITNENRIQITVTI